MIVAILQARVSSSRLPGKVLKPILGKAMILRQIERIKRVKSIDQLVVATSTEESDDALADTLSANEIDCFRGNLNDVLDRIYQAAKLYKAIHVVRLTGDCPLADPVLIDKVVKQHISGHFDATGADMTQYPDGLDVEVFSFSALERAWKEAKLPSEREHVGPFIWNHPEFFRHAIVSEPLGLSCLRWTVDEELDFNLVSNIYTNLYPKKADFTTKDILAYLEQFPHLKECNTIYKRNEGYQKSLLKDVEVLGMG